MSPTDQPCTITLTPDECAAAACLMRLYANAKSPEASENDQLAWKYLLGMSAALAKGMLDPEGGKHTTCHGAPTRELPENLKDELRNDKAFTEAGPSLVAVGYAVQAIEDDDWGTRGSDRPG